MCVSPFLFSMPEIYRVTQRDHTPAQECFLEQQKQPLDRALPTFPEIVPRDVREGKHGADPSKGHVSGSGRCIGVHFNTVLLSAVRRHSASPSHTLEQHSAPHDGCPGHELFIDAQADKLFPARRASRNSGGHPSSKRRHRVPADNFCVTKCRGCHTFSSSPIPDSWYCSRRAPLFCRPSRPADFALLSCALELIKPAEKWTELRDKLRWKDSRRPPRRGCIRLPSGAVTQADRVTPTGIGDRRCDPKLVAADFSYRIGTA